MKTEPFNPMPDLTCRTIKSQYAKNGIANFIRKDGLGVTAVIVVEDESEGGRSDMEKPAERNGL